jgi:predicted Rossmann-fold nucleotide-binding protein
VLSSDVLVALPGGAGTRSECVLAQRYGVPLVAWVESAPELPGLPPELPRASALADVEAFVVQRLGVPGGVP